MSEVDVRFARGYLKVDELGRLVDIRSMSEAKLSGLVAYYGILSKRARSPAMKDLYAGIHEDLTKFLATGLVPRVDALSFARSVGIQNVRYFMDTYWHGQPFPEDSGTEERQFFQNIQDRDAKYVQLPLPSDETIQRLYQAAVEQRSIHQTLRELVGNYGTRLPTIVEVDHGPEAEPEEYLATYDSAAKSLVVTAELRTDGIRMLFIIASCFFQHLSNVKGWRFSHNLHGHMALERKEADTFAESILNRLEQLGYLARRHKDD